jgi:uncharacterized protein
MSSQPPGDQSVFDITHHESPASDTLLVGFAEFGLAGLTAADHLVTHLDLDEIGHVTTEQLPAVTPFEDGTPRHPSRLFSRPDLDITVFMNELFVPPWAADTVAESVLDWTNANDIAEVGVLSGVPYQHGPDQHRTFYVATEDYQTQRLQDTEIPPMPGGFFNGVNARFLARGMDSSLRTGAFVTPVHAQAPDIEAAIRLLEAVEEIYEVEIDTDPLRETATSLQQYYSGLAEQLEAEEEEPDWMFG